MDDRTEWQSLESARREPHHDAQWAHASDDPAGSGDGSTVARSEALFQEEGLAAAHGAEQNRLLRALPFEEYARLLPQLTPVRLALRQVLVEPDVPIRDIYFPREGVGSMIADQLEEGSVEVSTVGPEGFIGLPVLLGAESMPYRVFVQVEGHGWRLPADAFRQLVDERPAVRHHFLRYAQYVLDQVSQSVACNRLHTLDERCARWLLMTHDRVGDRTFELTHEFLALMLGVRRAGVTVAMGTLQAVGVVRYTRGRITILDRARLEEASCRCYHITRTALGQLLG